MRAWSLAWVLLSCSGCWSVLPAKPPLVSSLVRSNVKTDAAQLKLSKHPDGETWRLSDERGQVVLLDVWATWCEPCRDALPLYSDIARQYAGRPFKAWGVSVDAEAGLISPFLAQHQVSLPVLWDPEARASEAVLKVKVMPTTFLLDKRGKVRHVHEGFDEGQFGLILEQIDALLAEPE